MTEQEWLACTDPRLMLEFLKGKVSERKVRLYACACCRRIWHLLSSPEHKNAVELAERFADGQATREEMGVASEAAAEAANPGHEEGEDYQPGWACAYASAPSIGSGFRVARAFCGSCDSHEEWSEWAICMFDNAPPLDTRLSRVGCRLVQEVFGNPFDPITLDPAWVTPTVKNLANAIYDDRAFDRLPILADALEDSGCASHDILDHCRQPGEHVRGCWAVDLVLGQV